MRPYPPLLKGRESKETSPRIKGTGRQARSRSLSGVADTRDDLVENRSEVIAIEGAFDLSKSRSRLGQIEPVTTCGDDRRRVRSLARPAKTFMTTMSSALATGTSISSTRMTTRQSRKIGSRPGPAKTRSQGRPVGSWTSGRTLVLSANSKGSSDLAVNPQFERPVSRVALSTLRASTVASTSAVSLAAPCRIAACASKRYQRKPRPRRA